MSSCQGLRPVYIALIFALGFFIFSQAPFLYNDEADKEIALTKTDSFSSVSTPIQAKLRRKRSEPEKMSTHDHEEVDLSKNSESLMASNDNDPGAKSMQKRNNNKVKPSTTTKKTTSAQLHQNAIEEQKRQNETRQTIEILKTKIMPRPEKVSNDSISIVIKKQPFHFHIPIVSGKRVSLPSFADLLDMALRYKHPLTLDVPPEKPKIQNQTHKSRKRQLLLEEGEEQEDRKTRNSPVLDFLDIDKIIQQEVAAMGKSGGRRINTVDDIDRVDGVKRAIEKVTPTAEILQQLIGDKDDLEILLQDKGKRKTRSGTVMTPLEIDVDNALKRKKRQHVRLQEREKRGLGKWLKTIFHKKTTTTTSTTTTEKPKLKDVYNKRNKNLKHSKKVDQYNVWRKPEIRNDTQVDMLLPQYLRTSSYYKRKSENQDYLEIASGSSSSSSEENSRELQQLEPEEQSSNNHKKYQKRFKRGIFDDLPSFQFPNQNMGGGQQFFPFAQPMSAFSSNPFIGNNMFGPLFKRSLSSLDGSSLPPPTRAIEPEPITSISKEEMKIINEMFSNIINEKCYPVNSQVLEVLQYTMSSLIDNSQWPEISSPNIPQVDYFLQKVVNCSSDAVNIMAWKSQRKMLMSSQSQDIEQGHTLLRTKRITDFDIEMERQRQQTLQSRSANHPGTNYGQIEKNQMQKLISLMSTLISDACRNIEPVLLSSTQQLISRTIDNTYNLMKITVETMTGKEASELIDSFTKCSTFSSVKRSNQNDNYFSHKKIEILPFQFQPNNNYKPQNLAPLPNQNNMNYWDRIPYYLQTIGLAKPSPVPQPPLQNPENMNNNNFQQIQFQQTRSTNPLPKKSYSSYSYSSSSSSASRDGTPQVQPNNHYTKQIQMQSHYSDGPLEFNRPKRNTFDNRMPFNIPILYHNPAQNTYKQNNANY